MANVEWVSPTEWGDIEISINLTKPEKDPRAIAQAAANPSCVLCDQNETPDGWLPVFAESAKVAQPNLRIGDVMLGEELWRVQYSPYHYFSQHCIAASSHHAPMHIDELTFDRLLRLVDAYPDFFMGSNADLPIVGGSILAHDHFQGGVHEFPMGKAPVEQVFAMQEFPEVRAGVVKWPVTVLRLESDSRVELAAAADHVLWSWRKHTDLAAGIVSESDGVRHNTVTPIARKVKDGYQLDLALRCNVTSNEHPFGVFHPHEHLHHIKRENVGLIEVMGLAILPPRVLDLLDSGMTREEIASAFADVLDCCGVFKWDSFGREALNRFLSLL